MFRFHTLICLFLFSLYSAVAQRADILPYDNLVVEGVPPIPATIAEQVGRYTEFRSASFQSWHPTDKELLILTRFADVPQIHRVIFPGGARTQLTFFSDRVAGASYNPKRKGSFIFTKDVGGGEWFQNYRYDVATGSVTLLTDGSSRNTLGVWSKDGNRMAYTSTRRTGKDTDLYTINPGEPSSDRLLTELVGGGWSPVDWSPDGKEILLMEYVSVNESYLWAVDGQTGTKTLLTPKLPGVQISRGKAEYDASGKGLFITSDEGAEFQQLMHVDRATMQARPLTRHIPWDIEDFELSPDGSRIAFTSNEAGIGKLRIISTMDGNEIPLPTLPPGIVSGIQWHPSLPLIGFNLSSARSATDVFSIDLSTGALERWTTSETGGLNAEEFSEPELVSWKSFDGKEISGFLYHPPVKFSGKRPVMVIIHGGPESQARPGFLGRSNFYLNELGIALLYPNVRGSSGYGKSFLKLDNGNLRQNSYKDIGALFDWIAGQPTLDAGRIMVTGGSYGGHMTFAVSTLYGDKIRCASPVVGMSNLVTFLERTEGYRRDLRRVEYGDERDSSMRAYLNAIAPLNNAGNITKPLLIVQGKNDPRVPYTEAEQMAATLKGNSVPVWFLMANDEGHGFAKKKNQDYQFYATVMFLQEFLLK